MKQYIEHLNSLSAKQLVLMLARQKQADSAPLAIVGTGCRLPGGVDNLDRLWQTLMRGEVHTKSYPEGPPGVLGKPRWSGAARGGFLTDLDQSDNPLGLDEEEWLYTDPQHRLLLDCTLDALHQAGLERHALRGKKVGVFIGISVSEYLYASINNGLSDEQLSAFMGSGTALSAAPARIAMLLESQGPTLALDTACSSALSALHLAKQALRNGECDWAVVGASHLLLSPYTTMVFDKANMLSKDSVARIFDEQADGHVRAEGAGVILLSRKDVMQANNCQALAWVRGSAIHQQGQRPAMSVSTGTSQQQVIRDALQDAQLSVQDIHYIEAHATGSRLATTVELENLQVAYRREAPLYVGSVKAHFGHLETVSGLLGLLKVIAVLKHRNVPAQVNLNKVADDTGHLKVGRDHQALPPGGELYAAVSSFGFTGVNTHAVLQSGAMNAGNQQHRTADAKRRVWPLNNFWS